MIIKGRRDYLPMDLYEAALQKAADEGYKVIENCNFESDAKD